MTTAAGPHGATLGGYVTFLRRNRLTIVALTLLGALAGTAIMLTQPVLYVAESRVAVTPQDVTRPTAADVSRRQLLSLDSDAQLLTSTRVLDEAAATSGFAGGAIALQDRLRVSAVLNSRVLIVQVSHPDRSVAVDATAAVVEAFLADRAAEARRRAEEVRADIEAQIATVLEQLGSLQTPLPNQPIAAADLTRQLAALNTELVLATATADDVGIVVRPATAHGDGHRPMAAATVCSGVLLGAAAGLMVAGWSPPHRRPEIEERA